MAATLPSRRKPAGVMDTPLIPAILGPRELFAGQVSFGGCR